MAQVKIENEIDHGKKIAVNAVNIWGWGTPAGQIRASRRANFFILLGGIESGKNVLELGCGTGEFTKRIAETGATITAIDISSELLQIAKSHIKKRNVTFMIQNVGKMNFSDETFDVVYGSSILHHLNLEPALREIHRVLKTGGGVVFTEPNMLNPQIWVERHLFFVKNFLNVSPDETAFIKGKLAKLMSRHGFQDVEISHFDFLHPFTPKILIPLVKKIGYVVENLPILKHIAGSLLISATKK